MAKSPKRGVSRRQFLQTAGTVAAVGAMGSLPGCETGSRPQATPGGRAIELIADFNDPVVSSPPARWALNKLSQALARANAPLLVTGELTSKPALTLMVAATNWAVAHKIVSSAQVSTAPESLALVPFKIGDKPALLAAGADGNGLAYALSELADRVEHGSNPYVALAFDKAVVEQPANQVRSVMRSFGSEEEDKPWYYDVDGWKRYFDMLATNRFNKFNLALGLAYDFSDRVVDGYFYFAYPFFLRLPGYNVRAIARDGKPLSVEEQDRNLSVLQTISKEAVARGIHFQLGLWTHSIRWPITAGYTANYTLDGITPATQAPYSRDALHALIEACPDIKGVTIRTHGESGIPEGNIDLWKVVFDGTKNLSGGRKVQIDLHAKGITFEIIEAARATGNPVIVTPKYWAEHMGLPYIQSSIRDWELPKADTGGLMSLSTGSRNHMRYGYGDIIIKDRKFGIVHRVFPGTQRFLLWGDPLFASEYGKMFSFNGTDGVEFMEQLTFKGRQGSGMAKNRSAYADAALAPKATDQKDKYEYTYRLWGRLTYNPDAEADVWMRLLRRNHKEQAASVERALGAASRILPMVTVAHSPSAAQANFWPEIYYNMSHYDTTAPTYADDTPSPKIFGTVSSLDPQLFATSDECAAALLAGNGLGKVSVSEVADQLDDWAGTALAPAMAKVTPASSVATRRDIIDATLAGYMGKFWAAKFRTGLFYSIFDKSGHEPARAAALAAYQQARDAMADAAKRADGIYVKDITFGNDKKIRGSWADRLAHIDNDMAGMKTARPRATLPTQEAAPRALAVAVKKWPRPAFKAAHTPAAFFKANDALPISVTVSGPQSAELAVRLWYRHINQAETHKSIAMQRRGDTFTAAIPADYTKSPYGLQYYFELSFGRAETSLYPGFGDNFTGMPYFVVPQA